MMDDLQQLVDPRLLRAVARMGFTQLTAVQAAAVPLALRGSDILARARTGSGKTLAYCLPVLQKVLVAKSQSPHSHQQPRAVSALILVPTRELAEQVNRVLKDLTHYAAKEISHVNIATTDVSLNNQRPMLLENPDVIVSTPSRVLAHIEAGNLDLRQSLETLVIDEADLILSYGHDDDIRKLLPLLPNTHQSLLMSATITSDVQQLKQLVLRKPAILKLEDNAENTDDEPQLTQYKVEASDAEKYLLTYFLLKLKVHPFGTGKTILFVNDTDRCYRLKLFLEQFGIRSCALNSSLPLKSRYHVVEEFNRGVYDIIIATDEASSAEDDDEQQPAAALEGSGNEDHDKGDDGDKDDADVDVDSEVNDEDNKSDEDGLKESDNTANGKKRRHDEKEDEKPKAVKRQKGRKMAKDTEYGVSRGVDFRRVQAVINFDLPDSAKAYMHRVGRTARGIGNKGFALSFVVPEDKLPQFSVPKASKKNKNPALENVKLPPGYSDEKVIERIIKKQEAIGGTVNSFVFDMEEVNAFKYRVEDALKAVTKTAIREARLKEIKQEIMNSEKLKAHFEDNPRDLQALRHDRPLHPTRIQPHLKHVPEYLVPKKKGGISGGGTLGSSSAHVPFRSDRHYKSARGRGRGRGRGSGVRGAISSSASARRKADPLKSF